MDVSKRVASLIALFAFAKAWLTSAYRVQLRRARARHPTSSDSAIVRAAQAGIVITVVVVGVVAMVGVLIFAQVQGALPEMSTNESDAAYSPLAAPLNGIEEGFGNAISFVPIIMLVLLASVVIGVVQQMRS